MNWFLLAIVGHASNAVAFIIDKTLLNSAFKRSTTYAALIGGLSVLGAVLFPWVRVWPSAALYPFIILFGVLFVFALVAFFEALKRAEASRIIPVVGSLIPLFTLIGSIVIFQQGLTETELTGFFLLLIATWLLTTGGRDQGKVTFRVILLAVLAAFLFAAASLCGKYAFDHGDWFAVFAISRVAAAVVGVVLGFVISGSRRELMQIFSGKERKTKSAAGLALVGQVCGGIGFALVNFALAAGSAAIVNALQAVQYALIILVAWLGGSVMRKALNEEFSRRVIIQKIIALVCVAIGLSLLA
ncbi:MAG: EamA family transporter [bacterium]|nr:EamA family transporter [bacterium]